MDISELKSIPGFADWLTEGEGRGYLRVLADHIDEKIGNLGVSNTAPHEANINLGHQQCIRFVRNLLKDPLERTKVVPVSPPATYGVGKEKEPDWK